MTRARRRTTFDVYQLTVTLGFIDPPVWRRVLVPGHVTLHRLHGVLQAVMGWENMHLYVFEVGDTHYSERSATLDTEMEDAAQVTLAELVPGEGFSLFYEYDMGDSWIHRLVVDSVLSPEPGVRYPVCVGGERACPPEDCGGPPGYEQLVEAVRNPSHERHEELLEWLGEPFHPEAFSVEGANAALDARRLRSS